MKSVIVQEKDNRFMKRKEIMLTIEHVGGATPSLAGFQLLLSKEFGVEPERIEIKNIFSYRGKPHSRSRVFVWDEKKVDDLSKPKEAVKEGDEKIENVKETKSGE